MRRFSFGLGSRFVFFKRQASRGKLSTSLRLGLVCFYRRRLVHRQRHQASLITPQRCNKGSPLSFFIIKQNQAQLVGGYSHERWLLQAAVWTASGFVSKLFLKRGLAGLTIRGLTAGLAEVCFILQKTQSTGFFSTLGLLNGSRLSTELSILDESFQPQTQLRFSNHGLLGALVWSHMSHSKPSDRTGLILDKAVTLGLKFNAFDLVAERLQLTYVVKYQALDRKLRKIVKNKYRYIRRYVAIRPADRIKAGLWLLKTVHPLYGERT